MPHATTCVALRYADGVVMAGDRRATAGNLISHRAMEKVVQADRYSGVAIAGAAGPAMEMIKLFQLQLEHYEKVEGSSLSLEGKANQLSMMVRGNLPGGDAGHGRRADLRRLRPAPRDRPAVWHYDVTGGRYEERDYVATGSGSLHAGTVIKVGYRDAHDARRSHRPGLPGAVGGGRRRLGDRRARSLRGIYPVVATIDSRRLAAGRRRRAWPRGTRRSPTEVRAR